MIRSFNLCLNHAHAWIMRLYSRESRDDIISIGPTLEYDIHGLLGDAISYIHTIIL